MYCSLIRRSDGLYQCEWCDWVYPLQIDKPPKRNCPNAPSVVEAAERLAEETSDPTVVDKTVCYAQALARWAAALFPTRTDEEVERIYREHCEPCGRRKDNSCGVCGCRVATKGMAIRNKIKMATESCTEGKWGEG